MSDGFWIIVKGEVRQAKPDGCHSPKPTWGTTPMWSEARAESDDGKLYPTKEAARRVSRK